MFETDKSFTAEEFKNNLVKLAQTMANRIPGSTVNLNQDNVLMPGYNSVLLSVVEGRKRGVWTISHSNNTGKVSCLRVLSF